MSSAHLTRRPGTAMKPNRVKLMPPLAVLLVAACGQPVAGEAVAGGEVRA